MRSSWDSFEALDYDEIWTDSRARPGSRYPSASPKITRPWLSVWARTRSASIPTDFPHWCSEFLLQEKVGSRRRGSYEIPKEG
jgi:hypothetical protein